MKPSHRLLLLLSSAAAVSACSPRRAAELFLLGSHFDAVQDLPYGEGPRQRLDVYSPRDVGGRPAPVIVFLYGGRWQQGSNDEYRLVGSALTGRGFVAVVPDYRLYPEVRFPAWVDDAAQALRWVSDSIRRFGGDPSHIVVVGHSAGAHTAALLALDEGYLRRAGVPPEAVRGVVSIAGPVAPEWTDRDVQALMGPREGWPATYPLRHVGGSQPPMLLLHGGRDETVSPKNSTEFAALVRERGGCARAIVYQGLGHVSIAVALAVPGLGLAPVLDQVAAFAREPAIVCGA